MKVGVLSFHLNNLEEKVTVSVYFLSFLPSSISVEKLLSVSTKYLIFPSFSNFSQVMTSTHLLMKCRDYLQSPYGVDNRVELRCRMN